jgi:transcriptional regulator with XRE-family HTH domain
MGQFDLPGALRRIRRRADLSQRELAEACGVSPSVVSHAEAGRRGVPVDVLARAAAVAGLRLGLVDESDREVPGMDAGAVRDAVGRRFPAHLDTRYGDVDWWHGDERYSRAQPWYTFDRSRRLRDRWRERLGTPEDHQRPQPGDSPVERRERRAWEAWHRREERFRQLQEAGLLPAAYEWTCTCLPGCDEVAHPDDDLEHAEECACRCDLD